MRMNRKRSKECEHLMRSYRRSNKERALVVIGLGSRMFRERKGQIRTGGWSNRGAQDQSVYVEFSDKGHW